MSAIRFKTTLFIIKSWTILQLPKDVSTMLPSRGQVMVKGTINGSLFQSPFEPDGNGSHWLKIDTAMQKSLGIQAGDTVTLDIEATKDWPEPTIPKDVKQMLDDNPDLQILWKDITPMARWEWLRWIGSTSQSETRKRRIETATSKMRHGERRPCCFNRSMCCVPEVSKNGVLLEPTATK